ncbi:MAG: tRNA uridine-5-carboxymethylaminomethyl(34) synthesis GTPase MnmE [Betaproteobacteria bacterium]|nr:tRNA uridine-5-carboxymethylaminomethyl(34) synthesis GTPase MnmE [Betaproteobacteria bacterium]
MGADDTIAAVATPAGRGAIGVVRVSGPAVPAIAAGIVGSALRPRTAHLADFRDGTGAALDRGLALYFPAPASYTGDDVLELQGHGGPVVLSLVLERCLELGARLAEPGEFTRRAFLNDKIDLAQAEAVADLIDAATARAALSAVRSLSGELSERVAALQQALLEIRVAFEASFDFPEEELNLLSEMGAVGRLAALRQEFARIVRAAQQGSLLRDGVTVALIGPPNVGKSSIINRLSGEEVAIVTPVPGTTRDLLRATIALDGIPVHLVDTAGLRTTEDPVEKIGVERARAAARQADLVLRIMDGTAESPMTTDSGEQTNGQLIHVHNKIDLAQVDSRAETVAGEEHVWISAKLGSGIELLKAVIVRAAGAEALAEGTFIARQRHLEALGTAGAHVAQAEARLDIPEFAAEELRLAQTALSRITGEQVADDLLGEIFSRFCIGK